MDKNTFNTKACYTFRFNGPDGELHMMSFLNTYAAIAQIRAEMESEGHKCSPIYEVDFKTGEWILSEVS